MDLNEAELRSSTSLTRESLVVTGLQKTYDTVAALADVSISISAGEFVTFLGPSGSGKTTLLMCIAGLAVPERGSITAGSRNIGALPPHRRNLGVVFQNYALFPHMTVAENIGFPLRVRGENVKRIRVEIDRALSVVQLGGYGSRRIDQLSGGQRQRVALARALVFEPGIVLLDEPLSALDKNLRDEMQAELRRLHRILGTTMLMVTHDQSEALSLSDRIAIMDGGKIVQIGTPSEIYSRPKNRFVAKFIGQTEFVKLDQSSGYLHYRGQCLATDPSNGSEKWFLAFRVETLICIDKNSPSDELIVLDGTVRDRAYRGETTEVYLSLEGGGSASYLAPGASIPEIGANVRVGIKRDAAIIVPGEA